MAPRHRISPPASLDDVASSSVATSNSSEKGPLLSRRSSSSCGSNSSSAAGSPAASDDEADLVAVPSAVSGSSLAASARCSSTTVRQPKIPDQHQQATDAADIARENHDIFNLVALLVVVGTTLCNWNFGMFLRGYGPGEAWTGRHFYLNWATTVTYFLIDLVWVSLVPICVKSPDVIVKHHIVAIAYLSAPVAFPEFRWFMGACLSVEINTWFLILRRVIYKKRFPQMIQDAVAISFYLSWIVIRCYIYPAILFVFLRMAAQRVAETNQLWHWPMLFIPVHFFLCVLNLKWSYDLFEPIVRKWISNDSEGPVIASGL